ncbi:TOTE conflict system archaeo-eukaryotic primase domain-containing protein [Marinicellulosiphila megalodicopiae]|uniref:TOTE conflict system archaeo-eukaryotic primase domain-containing protein n=1 Tax=Marinicellulosiphila megalodicopiae TaxID=2724896 RepID=UPI003BAEB7D8
MNHTIDSINIRLEQLEKEQEQLLAIKENLLNTNEIIPSTESFSTDQKITIFRNLFRGRSDIFATRWQNKQGRSGYSVACNNEWIQGICNKPRVKCSDCNHRQYSELDEQIIYQHLAGQKVVGIYPLLHDNSCYFLAADFDKDGWQDEVKALSVACSKYSIPHCIEISRSGNGAHLWVFFQENVPAKTARLLGFALLDKAMEIYPNLSFDSYDRLFPNQDIMPEGGFGNLIALPLQKEARLSSNSTFVSQDLQIISNQWQYLSQIESISTQILTELLTKISPTAKLFNEQQVIEKREPWELTAKVKPLLLDNPPNKITITLANHIYFKTHELPSPLIARLRRLASFSNPVFFKTQALRFSTHGIPRIISCARIEQGYLSIPRGCLDEAIALLTENKIDIEFDDKRNSGVTLKSLKPLFTLRKNQQNAVNIISKHDTGVLHAPTAFGKTVTAIALIAKRKTNTLILIHSRQLLDQWQERIQTFLPEIQIGIIGGGKKKPSSVIDIATYQSLINKKDNSISDIVQDYGQVIIDECHHISAPRFEMVINEIRAKYVLGLTATPERQDGQQKIIFMCAGPIRHKVKNDHHEKFEQDVIIHKLYDQPPESLLDPEQRPKISDAYRWILENKNRTEQIVQDVLESVKQTKQPLVLTERREHAEIINTMLLEQGISCVVLKGAMRVAERKKAEEQLATAKVVVATGKYVGEGFDLPRLDTLFLAMPIAWKGTLAQYAGRIHREIAGKESVTIHDYVDCHLPMLDRMFKKREKSYKTMGYAVIFEDDLELVNQRLL